MNLLKELLYEDLEGTQKELADCVGFKNYKKLVSKFGGKHISISPINDVCAKARNRNICKEYDGSNLRKLALKYNLNVRSTRCIIKRAREQGQELPLKE